MGKTILLINPAQEDGHSSPHAIHRDIPPISLLTLASYIEKFGHKAYIVDCHTDKDYKRSIYQILTYENIDAIGITVIIGNFIKNACEITEMIKDNSIDIPIIWGGPLVSVMPEACLREGNADYLILHQGEEPLRQFLDRTSENDKYHINNLVFLNNDKVYYNQINSEPLLHTDRLSWELLYNDINEKQIPYLAYIFSSRGCPYKCTFCYHQSHVLKGRKCFFRSSESILEELDFLNQKYGISVFTFGDDNFLTNKARAIRILDGMRERGYHAEQLVGAINDFSDPVIKAMSGVCQTAISSIESASERLIKLINKPIVPTDAISLNKKLVDNGINSIHNFMFGIPTETQDDIMSAFDLMSDIKKINKTSRGIAYFFTPLPGTPLCNLVEEMVNEKFPRTLEFWQDCDLSGPSDSYKYRPWLTKEEQVLISKQIALFRVMFKCDNPPYILNKILREKGLI